MVSSLGVRISYGLPLLHVHLPDVLLRVLLHESKTLDHTLATTLATGQRLNNELHLLR